MNSLTVCLNLGRDLEERLARHSLLSELLRNLSLISSRSRPGQVPIPQHRYMTTFRHEIDLTPQMIEVGQKIPLSNHQITSLAFALAARTNARNLGTESIRHALIQGAFLVFDPATATFKESPEHTMLRQTCQDIERLCELDRPAEPHETPQWHRKVLELTRTRPTGRSDPLDVPAADLVFAFAYHDVLEDIFNAHVSLCRVLLGHSAHVEPFNRSPQTPLGHAMELGIREERVSAENVRSLLDNDIRPFGKRASQGDLGRTREERLATLVRLMKSAPDLQGFVERVDESLLREVAEDILDKHFVDCDGRPAQATA